SAPLSRGSRWLCSPRQRTARLRRTEELLDVVDTAKAVRRELRDGQPPAYLFSSPCCGARTLLPAWVIEYARCRTDGRLLIQCGRYGSDPLRPAGAILALGCGSRFVVEL